MTTGTEMTSSQTTIKSGITGTESTNMRAKQNSDIENKDNQYKQLTGFGVHLDITV